MNAIWIRVACALVIVSLSGTFRGARAQSPATYNVSLSHAEISVDDSGRTVVTMMAAGDLRGALTVRLERAADGAIAGGEWAFTVSYTEIAASVPPPDGGEDDPGEMLVQKGVLKGTVTGGQVGPADGGLETLIGVRVALTGGTLAYDAITSGSGSIDGSNMADRDASSGSFTLTF